MAALRLEQNLAVAGHSAVVVEAARTTYFSALGRLTEIALVAEEAIA